MGLDTHTKVNASFTHVQPVISAPVGVIAQVTHIMVALYVK